MAKQKRDAEATKARILQSAMLLFSKNGYDATTADDVAKDCDITKAMIFYYFKNKAGLYSAVMESVLEAIHTEILTSKKCCVSPLADLRAFITTYATYSYEHPYLPALLLRELSNSGAHLPEMMFASMRKLFMLLSLILSEGEKQKLFHGVEPMIVHFMIIGTINLLITTKDLRKVAVGMDTSLNTCSECSIEEIADYIYEKIKLMLECKNEKNIACV